MQMRNVAAEVNGDATCSFLSRNQASPAWITATAAISLIVVRVAALRNAAGAPLPLRVQ
jgi:hypothetical protein